MMVYGFCCFLGLWDGCFMVLMKEEQKPVE